MSTSARRPTGPPAPLRRRLAGVRRRRSRWPGGVSRATVDYQLAFARQLIADHPRLLEACLDGQVSQSAAKHVVAACDVLDPEQRRAIDPELAELAGELTPGDARARHGDGDDRSIDQIMCDTLVERVTGQAKADQLPLEVAVVISASSLLGVDDQPAKLVGHNGGDYGVLPAGLARRLAANGDAWSRRLVCDPIDGRLVTMDTGRRRFTGALRRFIIYRDGVSRRPYSSTPIYDINHLIRHADGGPTAAVNAEGLGKYDHVILDLPGWASKPIDADAANGIRWTTPTGRTYESRPPPILGHGNTKPPTRRGRPWWPVVELHKDPVAMEYAARPHRRSDN